MEVGRAEARTQIYGLIVLKEHIDSGWKLEERSCGDKWLGLGGNYVLLVISPRVSSHHENPF